MSIEPIWTTQSSKVMIFWGGPSSSPLMINWAPTPCILESRWHILRCRQCCPCRWVQRLLILTKGYSYQGMSPSHHIREYLFGSNDLKWQPTIACHSCSTKSHHILLLLIAWCYHSFSYKIALSVSMSCINAHVCMFLLKHELWTNTS